MFSEEKTQLAKIFDKFHPTHIEPSDSDCITEICCTKNIIQIRLYSSSE